MITVVTAAGSPRAWFGRDEELAIVSGFLDARAGGPAALIVEGEPGIGKTTLLRAAFERARLTELRVLSARPGRGEAELPFAALGDLLGDSDEDAMAVLAKPQREAVEIALARSPGALNEHSLARGVLELIRAWSADRRVLIAIDDAQWLDRPTAAVLAFAMRRLGRAHVRVLVARRTTTTTDIEPLLALGDLDDLQRLVVGPMSATDLGTLLRERIDRDLPRPRVELLHELSGGNPMFALELAERGAPDGATLSRAIANRLHKLDPAARTACSYVAAALRPSTELLVTAGVSSDELKAAVQSGVIETAGGRLRLSHPMFGSVAYELLLPDERREIHRRLADASEDPVERGHHVSRAAVAPDPIAGATVSKAAEAAAGRGDHSGAAALLLRAADLSPGTAAELQVAAAEELMVAGDVEAAGTLARRLVDDLPRGVPRAKARKVLAMYGGGEERSYEDSLVELEAALEDADTDLGVQAEVHLEMSDLACGLCRLDDAMDHARAAAELAERAGDGPNVVAALSKLGFIESMLGRGVTQSAQSAFARWDGSIRAESSPRMELACCYLHATQFDEAAVLFELEATAAETAGVEPVEVVARAHLAEAQLRAGRWAEALADARVALDHARQAADRQIVGAVSCVVGMAEALSGSHEVARSLAAAGLESAEELADFWWTIGGRSVLGLIALAEDDVLGAVETLEPAWALMRERRLGDLSIFPVAHVLGEALVACGRTDDALRVATALRECPVGEQPWCRAMANRIAALVAAAQDDPDAARKLIAAALEAHADLPEPFEHARTVHLLGRIERSNRNWGAARAAFLEALERFDQLGAARWAEKTTADLARLPGRRPADPTALTTREREVSELVAAGLSNKEIAARLFLSVRAVEANLSKAFAKLGVRSRAELAGRLNRGPW
jgi:DNA-binding NarL/FixJ family response regulator